MTKKIKKKYIFIDTNLYRNLFIYSEYEERIFPILEKLVQDEYFILMPQQVLDEINRNIFSVWSSGNNQSKIKNLEKAVSELNQDFLSKFSYTKKLIDQINKVIIKFRKEDKTLQKQLISPRGRSARLIKKLLDITKVIPDTEEIFKATQQRVIKGNPPFDNINNDTNEKNCDRYIWESLLFYFKENKIISPTLYIFTKNENDWCSINEKEKQFLQFLLYEFNNKTKGKIIWYKNLENLPNISSIDKKKIKAEDQKFEKEYIIKTLPEKLLISNSWDNTDKIILGAVNYIPEFSSLLISEILNASLQNNNNSAGPYNQVLDASKAQRFFMKLYNYSKEINFPLTVWRNFYLQLDEEQQKRFYDIRKDIEGRGIKFSLGELKFIHPNDIPF